MTFEVDGQIFSSVAPYQNVALRNDVDKLVDKLDNGELRIVSEYLTRLLLAGAKPDNGRQSHIPHS